MFLCHSLSTRWLQNSRTTETTRRASLAQAIGVVAVVTGALALASYMYLHSLSVVSEAQLQAGGELAMLRVVVGDELLPHIAHSEKSDLELLREAGYRAADVWTANSLTLARIKLLGAFVSGFSLINAGLVLLAITAGKGLSRDSTA